MNFQQLPNGSYDYIRVGDWNNGTLIMQDDELQWPRPGGRVESVCSRPCQPGFYKVQWCNASQLVTVNFEQIYLWVRPLPKQHNRMAVAYLSVQRSMFAALPVPVGFVVDKGTGAWCFTSTPVFLCPYHPTAIVLFRSAGVMQ